MTDNTKMLQVIFFAVLFGIGMVIAGGCASGTLMRVGEGFGMQMLSLFFFIVGSLLGAAHFGWWKLNFIVRGPKIFLPDIFGWVGAVVLQLLIIALLWIAADKWAKRKSYEGDNLDKESLKCPVSGCQGYRRLQSTKLNLLITCNKNDSVHKNYISGIRSKKIAKTCLKKYGVSNPGLAPEVRNKIIKTNQEKYGCNYPFQNKNIQDKV